MAFLQAVRLARSFPPMRAGRSIATRMAITAITTRSSINVKAFLPRRLGPPQCAAPCITLFLRFDRQSGSLTNKVSARVSPSIDVVETHTPVGQDKPLVNLTYCEEFSIEFVRASTSILSCGSYRRGYDGSKWPAT